MKTEEEIIKIWKELKIERCEMTFDCGGDSMGSTDYELFNDEGDLVTDKRIDEIIEFIDSDVYNNVEFYVNSDGHYIGEAGMVMIGVDNDNDVEFFSYSKSSESCYSEMFDSVTELGLEQAEVDFINEYVLNINGNQDETNINYKKDFILTEEIEKVLKKLKSKINDFTLNYSPIEDVDMQEWFSFESECEIDNDNNLKIEMSNEYYHYTSE